MFNAAPGSILIAALFHFQLNNPAWPDAQPWDTLVRVSATVVIVLLNRRALLSRAGAVTAVILPRDGDGPDTVRATADGTPHG